MVIGRSTKRTGWIGKSGSRAGSALTEDQDGTKVLYPVEGYGWTLNKDFRADEDGTLTTVSGLVYDSFNKKLVAGITSSGGDAKIFTSGDNGQTWTLKKTLTGNTRIDAMCFDSTNNRIVAGTYNKGELWVSTDGGENWVMKKDLTLEAIPQNEVNALIHDPANDTIVASTRDGANAQVWGSADAGETWALKLNFALESPSQGYVHCFVFDSENDALFLGTEFDGQIWKSTDGGDNWTLKKDLSDEAEPRSAVNALGYDPVNKRIIAGAYQEGTIYTSADGGETWDFKLSLKDTWTNVWAVQDFAFDPLNDIVLAGCFFTVLVRSSDGGETWELSHDFGEEVPSQSTVKRIAVNTDTGEVVVGTGSNAQVWIGEY